MGGVVCLQDKRQLFFQRAQMLELLPWIPPESPLQSFIAAWELAAQVALLLLLHDFLGPGHLPVHVISRSDNSASESASWKGLSTAKGLCSVLRSFIVLQEHLRISVHTDHVPGISNDVADALSRSSNPSDVGFSSQQAFPVTGLYCLVSSSSSCSRPSTPFECTWPLMPLLDGFRGSSPGGSSVRLAATWSDRPFCLDPVADHFGFVTESLSQTPDSRHRYQKDSVRLRRFT